MKKGLVITVLAYFVGMAYMNAQTTTCATQCPTFNSYQRYITESGYVPGTTGTFEAWIYLNSISSTANTGAEIIGQTSSNPGTSKTDLYVNPNGKLELHNHDANVPGTYYNWTGNTILSTGEWYHVAATWASSAGTTTVNLYVNGILDYSVTTSWTWSTESSTYPVYIGAWDWGANNSNSNWHLDGKIDEVRIWSTVRTQCDIIDNMEQFGFFNTSTSTTGLECYYQFNESSLPVTTADISGHGNTATLQGINTWGSSDAPIISTNALNASCTPTFTVNNSNSLNFTGGYEYVTTNTYYPGSTGTMEAWINMTTSRNYNQIFCQTYTPAGISQMDLYLDGNNHLVVDNYNSTAMTHWLVETATTTTFVTGHWYHVAATWDYNAGTGNSTVNLYVNGCLELTATVSHVWETNTTYPFTIGGWDGGYGLNNSNFEFYGYIDEVKIWNTVKSQNDIVSNMYNSVPTSYPGDLKCYYKFDNGSGTTATNAVAGGPNGTLTSGSGGTLPGWSSTVAPINAPVCSNNCRLMGVGEAQRDNSIRVYPNPSAGLITIESKPGEKQLIQVFDINSQQVLTKSGMGKTEINLNGLANGIYFVNIISDNGIVTKKVVLNR